MMNTNTSVDDEDQFFETTRKKYHYKEIIES